MSDGRAHVLIVEDSHDVSTAYKILFEARGYRASTAATVAAAVDVALNDPVDLMLLDLTLPDGNGLQVLEALREGCKLPRRAVALTGHDEIEIRELCLGAGCAEVLLKPVPPRELLRKAGEWLG